LSLVKGSRGFTLIEALVALSLTLAGVGLAWQTLRRHGQSESLLREKWAAMEALQNASESFLAKPHRPWDTVYTVQQGIHSFWIRQSTLDSAAILEKWAASMSLGEAEKRFRLRPREMKMEAWLREEKSPLATLSFFLPDQQRP
jgi:Tfp pilus assembly protein PilV